MVDKKGSRKTNPGAGKAGDASIFVDVDNSAQTHLNIDLLISAASPAIFNFLRSKISRKI